MPRAPSLEKPEVKKIPKRPGEKEKEKKKEEEKEKESEKEAEKSPSRAPIELRSRSLPGGRGKVNPGAKRFLTKAVLEAANDVGLRAKKKRPPEKKEKSSSPKPRERSR